MIHKSFTAVDTDIWIWSNIRLREIQLTWWEWECQFNSTMQFQFVDYTGIIMSYCTILILTWLIKLKIIINSTHDITTML